MLIFSLYYGYNINGVNTLFDFIMIYLYVFMVFYQREERKAINFMD